MKINKLLKTGALALGTVASIAAPIAAVVSCGSSTDNSGTVVIKYTWAANGPQIKALQPVVDYYNKNVAGANDYKVKLVHVEGGYGKAVELDRMDIKMNNMNPVADAIIDYPDSLGTLGTKALNFGGDMAKDFADPKYLTTSMEGQASTNGAFSLPLAKSTEMLTIDIPFMAALEKENIITITATKLKATVDAYKGDNGAEIDKIVSGFKLASTPTTAVVEITDDVLTDYNKLFDAGDKISNALTTTKGKAAKLHIIGEDAPTNLFYQLYNAKAGYDSKKFLFNDNAQAGKFTYEALKNKASTGGAIVDGILHELNTHIGTGSLVMNGGGSYSSSNFINHALPFVIGSTAGFEHNYKGQAAFEVKSGSETVSLSGYNKELVAASTDKAGAVAMTPDKYHNGVYVFSNDHNGSNHEIAVTTEGQTIIKNAIKANKAIALKQTGKVSITDDFETPLKAFLTKLGKSESDLGNTIDLFPTTTSVTTPEAAVAAIEAELGTTKSESAERTALVKAYGKFLGDDIAISGDYAYKIVVGDKVAAAPSKDVDHVNANEVLSLPAPNKSATDGATVKEQIISQGPSFIGIQHGGKKDAQTIKFMKWFFGKDSKITDASGNTASPIDSFDQVSGYITPAAGAFDPKNRSKYTKGNLVAFDAFSEITKNVGIPFDNPVTKHSSAVRKSIETTIKAFYTDYDGQGKVDDAKSLYDTLAADIDQEISN